VLELVSSQVLPGRVTIEIEPQLVSICIAATPDPLWVLGSLPSSPAAQSRPCLGAIASPPPSTRPGSIAPTMPAATA
jgi:hypothetical protein